MSARAIVGIELVLAALLVLAPLPIPILVPLVIGASVSLGLRGSSWLETGLEDERFLVRLFLGGLVGLALAFALHYGAGPASVDMFLLRGNGRALFAGLFIAVFASVAHEMVFRGYLISRLAGAWGPAGRSAGVVLGALLSTLAAAPGNPLAAMAVFVLGCGYGLLYLAGRGEEGSGSLGLPIGAHLAMSLHALVFEYLGL